MKILHVITTINRGGAENHLVDLAIEQKKLGHQVHIAYLKGDGYWSNIFELNNIKVNNLKMSRYGNPIAIIRLICIMTEWKPELIHAHLPPAEIFAAIAKIISLSKAIFLITKHNIERFCPGFLDSILFKFTIKQASKVIAISKAVATYLTEKKVSNGKVCVIYYGIDPKMFSKNKSNSHLNSITHTSDTFVFGSVCRLVPQKAVDVLLKGYCRFLKESNVKSNLCIVGSGILEKELKDLAKELGIDDHVTWLGQRADIPEILNFFDVFVLTSIYEGFGLVLIEAMAAKLPVIATNVCSIPEIVTNGQTGILVEPSNVEYLAKAMLKITNEANLQQYGQSGFEKVKEQFSIKKMIELTEQVYSQ